MLPMRDTKKPDGSVKILRYFHAQRTSVLCVLCEETQRFLLKPVGFHCLIFLVCLLFFPFPVHGTLERTAAVGAVIEMLQKLFPAPVAVFHGL